MATNKTDDTKTDDEALDETMRVLGQGAAVALVGLALWIGGMVVAGKINDSIFGRE